MLVRRKGEPTPVVLETEPVWMWHVLNAYERGGEIVADFVGYDAPDHFLGDGASLFAAMSGREGVGGAEGTLRRFLIDPVSRVRLRHHVPISFHGWWQPES